MLPKLKHIVMCLNNFTYIRVEQGYGTNTRILFGGTLTSEDVPKHLYPLLEREIELIEPKHVPREDILIIHII